MLQKKLRILFVFLFVLVVAITIFFFAERFLIGNFSFSLQNVRINAETTYESMTDADNLKEQNLSLKSKIIEYEQELLKMEELRTNLELISKENNIVFPEEQELVFANVLDNSAMFIDGIKILNVGLDMNLNEGDLVIAHGALVGEVKKLYKYTAEIQLLSHNDSVYSVYLEDGSLAVVSGTFDSQKLYLSKIPRDAKVSENSIVKLASTILYPNRIPIVIGTIDEFIDVKEEPFLEATISPALEYKYLKNVFVLRTK